MNPLPAGVRRPWFLLAFAILAFGSAADPGTVPVAQAGPAARTGEQQARPDATRPQATYRVEVNYVEVTARVTSADGEFVVDLGRDDFELLENGRPQAISDFRLVDLATTPRADVSPAWRDAEPDVRTTAIPFDGRVYVLVLDTLHVAAERSGDVRRMARRFLEQYFVDGDMAAVVNTTGAAQPAQELTTSRARLLSAVDTFMGSKGNGEGAFAVNPAVVSDIVPGGATRAAEDVLSSLKTLTELLSGVHGRRKAVVFISEGPAFCLDAQLKGGARGALNQASQALVAAANRGNVAIYGIDPRGLDPSIGDCDLDAGIQSLRSISNGTGGFATVNSNNFDAGFDRIQRENSRYYVLGYYPSEHAPEGSFRKFELRTRRPGLQVEARQGYMTPRHSPARPPEKGSMQASALLRDAMDSVLPVNGLRLAASAAPFRGARPGAEVVVSVWVDGRDVTFKSAGGRFTGGLELAVGTMNSRGESGADEYSLVEMPLEGRSHSNVASAGIRIVRSLAVAPGRHQLRVGVLDRPTGRVGVVHLDLIVPDFRKAAFGMSGMLLSSSLAGMVPTAPGGPLGRLQRQLPGPPTLAREFRADEDLALYAEVYGARPAAPDLLVEASVVDEDGREIYRSDDTEVGTAASGVVARDGMVEIHRVVPLRGLLPGCYLLRFEAGPAVGGEALIRREVPFSIVR